MCIVSSVNNFSIAGNIAFIADVGLTGELKKVPALEQRLRELERRGFEKVYIAQNALPKGAEIGGLTICQFKLLQQVINDVFKK